LTRTQAGTCGLSICLPWKGTGLKTSVRRGPTTRKGAIRKVEVIETVFEVIDMRSFSNLWYWIALAVLWSSTSHWVLGVPHDLIQRGRREGGQAQQDLEDLVRINSSRLLAIIEQGGLIIVALAGFWISVLFTLGFVYNIEFAQALFLLLFPMTFVIWLSVRACRRIRAGENQGEALHRRMIVHRRWTQVIGMLAILVTAMYGTWQNISISILH